MAELRSETVDHLNNIANGVPAERVAGMTELDISGAVQNTVDGRVIADELRPHEQAIAKQAGVVGDMAANGDKAMQTASDNLSAEIAEQELELAGNAETSAILDRYKQEMTAQTTVPVSVDAKPNAGSTTPITDALPDADAIDKATNTFVSEAVANTQPAVTGGSFVPDNVAEVVEQVNAGDAATMASHAAPTSYIDVDALAGAAEHARSEASSEAARVVEETAADAVQESTAMVHVPREPGASRTTDMHGMKGFIQKHQRLTGAAEVAGGLIVANKAGKAAQRMDEKIAFKKQMGEEVTWVDRVKQGGAKATKIGGYAMAADGAVRAATKEGLVERGVKLAGKAAQTWGRG